MPCRRWSGRRRPTAASTTSTSAGSRTPALPWRNAGTGAGRSCFIPTTCSAASTAGTSRSRPARATRSSIVLKAKDGSYRWFMGRAFPMRDEQGAVLQWVGNCADIDDQKRARDVLERRVVERTAEVVGGARAAAVGARFRHPGRDHRGRRQGLDHALQSRRGADVRLCRGRVDWQSAIPRSSTWSGKSRRRSARCRRSTDGPSTVSMSSSRTSATASRRSTNGTLVRKDGSRFPAELMITAMHDGGTEITGFLGIVTDISARAESGQAAPRPGGHPRPRQRIDFHPRRQ